MTRLQIIHLRNRLQPTMAEYRARQRKTAGPRTHHGLTQREFAKRLGVSLATVTSWERKYQTHAPGSDSLKKLTILNLVAHEPKINHRAIVRAAARNAGFSAAVR